MEPGRAVVMEQGHRCGEIIQLWPLRGPLVWYMLGIGGGGPVVADRWCGRLESSAVAHVRYGVVRLRGGGERRAYSAVRDR